jgi:CRP-like cAMP-binding protein
MDLFEDLLPNTRQSCAFRVVNVAERETLPHSWFGKFALGLVRRGILVRQRIDEEGVATAIDVVGPGGAILLTDKGGAASGYAVSESMVCLCPDEKLNHCSALPTALDMVRLHASALERMDRLADARNRPNAHARVAALLGTLAEVLTPPRRLDVIPSQLQRRDLAALLGLRHESVSRTLSDLERDGVVKRTPDGLALTRGAV